MENKNTVWIIVVILLVLILLSGLTDNGGIFGIIFNLGFSILNLIATVLVIVALILVILWLYEQLKKSRG